MDNKNIFYFKLKIIFIFILSFITLFIFFRLYSIFFINKEYFQNINLQCILINIIYGIKFDLYIAGVFIMPILLFLFIPYKRALYSKLIILAALFMYMMICILNYSDIQFFYHFHKHMTIEIFTAIGHIYFLFITAVKNYFPFLLLTLTISVLIIYFLNKKISSIYINSSVRNPISLILFIPVVLVYIILAFIFIRGNLNPHDRPIRSLDANLFSSKCNLGGGDCF